MRMLPPSEILARAGGVPAVPEEQVVRTARLIAELGFRSPVVVAAVYRIVQGAARVLVGGGSSHPQRSARLGALVRRERPPGPVLLVDDPATTGLHVEQALGALRGEGVPALAMVWISEDVK
jgi:hypothetical protein